MHLGTRSLTLAVEGVSRTADVSDCRIVSGPHPFLGGGWSGPPPREYRLQGTAAQDLSEGSLWDLVWSNPDMRAEVEIRPAGGVVASVDQPAFIGTVVISEPDGDLLGGRANPSVGGRFTFVFDWRFTAKPTRDTGAPW